MSLKEWVFRLLVAMLVLGYSVSAQETARLSLTSETIELQTGQRYMVTIQIDDVSELWLIDLEISYDASLIYVIGTEAGSPITAGPLFPPDSLFLARNGVIEEDRQLIYTASLLAPVEPISGNGVLGTFEIVPLSPGPTRLLFSQGDLRRAIFTEVDGTRITEGSEPIPFAAVLLDLNVTGDPVERPSEATATPRPTFTPDPALVFAEVTEAPLEPTLVNVTAAPRPVATVTPIPAESNDIPAADDSSGLLILAVIFILIGGFGGLGLLIYARRRR